jgi:hypothetical protein
MENSVVALFKAKLTFLNVGKNKKLHLRTGGQGPISKA